MSGIDEQCLDTPVCEHCGIRPLYYTLGDKDGNPKLWLYSIARGKERERTKVVSEFESRIGYRSREYSLEEFNEFFGYFYCDECGSRTYVFEAVVFADKIRKVVASVFRRG